MSESAITALAREYAEEYTKKKYSNAPGHVRERIVEGRLEHMEDFILWLLRRFCLVEKEVVRKEYHEIKLALGDGGRSEWEDDINMEKERLLESIFPEIAKEVES